MHVLVVGPDQLHHVVRPLVLLVINSPAVIDLIQWISCLNLIKAQSRAQNQKKPPSLWFVDSFCALNSVRKCGSKDHTVFGILPKWKKYELTAFKTSTDAKTTL